jgi:hypothetical protein
MIVVAVHEQQLDPHAPRGLAVHGIQDMRRKASTTRHVLLRL